MILRVSSDLLAGGNRTFLLIFSIFLDDGLCNFERIEARNLCWSCFFNFP